MNNNKWVSNLKVLYVYEYIRAIESKNRVEDITNNKYSFVVSLFYNYEALGYTFKEVINLIYYIARGDENIKNFQKRREMR